MENLQRHYPAQLEAALEYSLHNNWNQCLEICWQLRLKPDLALYTHALVNIAIASQADITRNPDKLKYAQEAVRLARRLQQESGRSEMLVQLESQALTVVDTVEKEEAAYRENWEASRDRQMEAGQSAILEDVMEDLQFLETPPSEQDPSTMD